MISQLQTKGVFNNKIIFTGNTSDIRQMTFSLAISAKYLSNQLNDKNKLWNLAPLALTTNLIQAEQTTTSNNYPCS